MSQKRVPLIVSLLLVMLLLWPACRRGGASWDTDISSPIFKTTFGIDNLVADSLLSKAADSSLTLVYKSSLTNFALDSLIHIPDTTVSDVYALPFGSHIFNCGDLITGNPSVNQTTYPLHGVGLKTSSLRSGKMTITITNKVRKRIQLSYQIPSASLAGVPFGITIWVDGRSGSTPGKFIAEYDLSGYTIDLTGSAKNSINTVITTITARIDPSLPTSDTVNVVNTDDLEVSSSFLKMVPEYAKGYFGQTVQKAGPSENNFPVFRKISGGSLSLQKVQLDFHIDNGIGVDARILIPDLYSKNSRTGQVVHLTAPIINSPININRAIETFSNPPVTSSSYSVTLNNANSNTKALIENIPDKIGYAMTISPDPLGNVSGYNDFIYYGYGIQAGMDMQLPLSLVANNLTIADTVPVNFNSSASNLERLHHCNLTLYADNGFPLSAGIQMYMLDGSNTLTDSLLIGQHIIDEAPVDANFKAIGMRQTILEIPVGSSKVNHLIRAKKIIIVARFNTSSQPNFIKIYDDYKMNFQLTGDFNYTIKLH